MPSPKTSSKRQGRDTVEEPAVRRRKERESQQPPPEGDEVQEAGEESFPASDPPSFTPEKTGQ